MRNIEFAVLAAAQPTGPGVSPLSAAVPDAGGFSLPVAWCATGAGTTGATSVKRSRLVSRQAAKAARIQALAAATKPGQTNNRNHVYMTRVNADGDGASGPHPPREPA